MIKKEKWLNSINVKLNSKIQIQEVFGYWQFIRLDSICFGFSRSYRPGMANFFIALVKNDNFIKTTIKWAIG